MPEIQFTINPQGHTDGEALEIRPSEWHALTNNQRSGRLQALQQELEQRAGQHGLDCLPGSMKSSSHHLRTAESQPDQRPPLPKEAAWLRVSAQFRKSE